MKSLKKNFIYQSAYQVLMVISPLITSPYLSRVLGAEKIGIYSYCYSIAYYFAIFAILGLSNYGNRSISKAATQGKDRVSQEFWELYAMQFISSIAVIVAYVIFVFNYSQEYRVNLLIEGLYILSICLDISWLYFGLEEFKTTTIRSFCIRLGTIISILLFVKSSDDLSLYTFIMAGGSLLSSIVLWTQLKKYVVITKISFTNVMKHFKPNLILFISSISLALFHYMDKVMVGALSTMSELGYYTNADKVINIPLGLVNALGVVMMPRIAKLNESGDNVSVSKYIHDSLIFTSWLGVAMCFGIMAISDAFVPVFFGSGYDACISLLKLLSPVILIKAWSGSLKMQCIIPFGKDKELNISVIVAAIVNLVFNFLLIPSLGSVGATFGTIIAEFCVLCFYAFFSHGKIDISDSLKWICMFSVAGLAMYFIVRQIDDIILSNAIFLIIGILAGASIYIMITALIFNIFKWQPYMTIQSSAIKFMKEKLKK